MEGQQPSCPAHHSGQGDLSTLPRRCVPRCCGCSCFGRPSGGGLGGSCARSTEQRFQLFFFRPPLLQFRNLESGYRAQHEAVEVGLGSGRHNWLRPVVSTETAPAQPTRPPRPYFGSLLGSVSLMLWQRRRGGDTAFLARFLTSETGRRTLRLVVAPRAGSPASPRRFAGRRMFPNNAKSCVPRLTQPRCIRSQSLEAGLTACSGPSSGPAAAAQ